MLMTNEEIIICGLIRQTKRFRELNRVIRLVPDDFIPGVTRDAFRFLMARLTLNQSLDPGIIYRSDNASFDQFDSQIPGLNLFCIWATEQGADEKLKTAMEDVKSESIARNSKGKLKTLISR